MINNTFCGALLGSFIVVSALTLQAASAQPAAAPADDADVRNCLNAVDTQAYDLAIALCGRALKNSALTPQDRVKALIGRGMGFSANGSTGSAYTAFTEALKIDPKSWTALVQRGYVHSRTKRRELALLDYSRAIEIAPNEPVVRSLRGVMLVRAGEYDGGIADLDIALRLAPDDVQALLWRGIAHEHQSRFDRAIADIDRAFELAPDDHEVLDARIVLLVRRGEFAKAATTIRVGQASFPDNAMMVANEGRLAWVMGDWKRAYEGMKRATEMTDNREHAAYFSMWMAMAALRGGGDLRAASAVLAEVARRAPRNTDHLTQVIALYRERIDRDPAATTPPSILPAAVIAETRNADGTMQGLRGCATLFKVGIFQIQFGERAAGLAALEEAARLDHRAWCTMGARAELARQRGVAYNAVVLR